MAVLMMKEVCAQVGDSRFAGRVWWWRADG